MHTAIICKIKVSPIPNAEKIQVANCGGYTDCEAEYIMSLEKLEEYVSNE